MSDTQRALSERRALATEVDLILVRSLHLPPKQIRREALVRAFDGAGLDRAVVARLGAVVAATEVRAAAAGPGVPRENVLRQAFQELLATQQTSMFMFSPELQTHLNHCWRIQQAELQQQRRKEEERIKMTDRRHYIVKSNDQLVGEMAFHTEEERVKVSKEFASANKEPVLLRPGTQGKVVRYEDDGNALVQVDGLCDLQQVSVADFQKIQFEKKQIGHTLPELSPIESFRCPDMATPLLEQRFLVTEFCVANIDTVTAALEIGDAVALNFANEHDPGGGYRHGAMAQEEELCRQVPQLSAHLETYSYPIPPGTALLSKGLAVVRRSGTYELCPSLGELNVITAAMPCGYPRPRTPAWIETVNLRIRSVLRAAEQSGFPNIVLGAFGCGAFGNPPDEVAQIFKQQLSSPEFHGAFAKVVFAIIDPFGDGNLLPFERALATLA